MSEPKRNSSHVFNGMPEKNHHHFELKVHSFQLKLPYKLSFGTIYKLDSIQVSLNVNGSLSIGEVVPLTGYNKETKESIVEFLSQRIAQGNDESDLSKFRKEVAGQITNHGFACSAILSALDLQCPQYKSFTSRSIISESEFVVPSSTNDPIALWQFLINHQEDYVKVKLSDTPEHDLEVLQFCEKAITSLKHPLRLDANQALDLKKARHLYKGIESFGFADSIHYIEQALPFDDWEGTRSLAKEFELPSMLDESIVLLDEIQKALDIGVNFIKLKLFKQGGILELEQMILKAKELGVKVILGNGVSTELGNNIENNLYQKYPEAILRGSEANGFIKLN